MKTLVTTLAIALAILSTEQSFAAAENTVTTSQSNWTVAPSLGVTSFKLKTDSMDLDAKSGMSVGAEVYKATGVDGLDLVTGLQYLQSGGKKGDLFLSYEVNLDYLAVPVGVRWKAFTYGADDKNFMYLRGGIAAAFLVSAKEKATFLGATADGDIKDKVNGFDLMAVAGLGGSYSMGNNQHILYELNYLRGTQKVMKDETSHSEGYAFNVMYSIPL